MCQLQVASAKIDMVTNILRRWRPSRQLAFATLPEELVQKIMSNFAIRTHTSFRVYTQFIPPDHSVTDNCPCKVICDAVTTFPDNLEIMCSRLTDPVLYRCVRNNDTVLVTDTITNQHDCPLLGRKLAIGMTTNGVAKISGDHVIDRTCRILNNEIDEFYPVIMTMRCRRADHDIECQRMIVQPAISEHPLVDNILSAKDVEQRARQHTNCSARYRSLVRIDHETTVLFGFQPDDDLEHPTAFAEMATAEGLPYQPRGRIFMFPDVRLGCKSDLFSICQVGRTKYEHKYVALVGMNLCRITVRMPSAQNTTTCVECKVLLFMNQMHEARLQNEIAVNSRAFKPRYDTHCTQRLSSNGLDIQYLYSQALVNDVATSTTPAVRIFYSHNSGVYILVYATGRLLAVNSDTLEHMGQLCVNDHAFVMIQFYPHADMISVVTTGYRILFFVYKRGRRAFEIHNRFDRWPYNSIIPEYLEICEISAQHQVPTYYHCIQIDINDDWAFSYAQTTRGHMVAIFPATECYGKHAALDGTITRGNHCQYHSSSNLVIGNMLEMFPETANIPISQNCTNTFVTSHATTVAQAGISDNPVKLDFGQQNVDCQTTNVQPRVEQPQQIEQMAMKESQDEIHSNSTIQNQHDDDDDKKFQQETPDQGF